ncbi:MAG: hypothetical protein ACREBD_04155 [Blastocatellia bacterium]
MKKQHLVVFLQNAWSEIYAGGTWPRPSWLRALERSRSGQRLKLLVDDLSVCENTTPIVGTTPSSVVPPDRDHIHSVLAARKPAVIVACGRQAELALLDIWPGPLLAIPHPAHRLVTNALYQQARSMLTRLNTRLALRQHNGQVIREQIPSLERE